MSSVVAEFEGDEVAGDDEEGGGYDDDDCDEERGESEGGVGRGRRRREVEEAPLRAVHAAEAEGAVSAYSIGRP